MNHNTKENDLFFNKKEAMKILGMYKGIFNKFVNAYGIIYHTLPSGQKRFYKDDILFFKRQQEYLGTSYLTSKMIMERYNININDVVTQDIIAARIKTPVFLMGTCAKGDRYIYESDVILKFYNKIKSEEKKKTLIGQNEFETFLLQLNFEIKKYPFLNEATNTKSQLISYAKLKMNTRENHQLKNNSYNISQFLNFASVINVALEKYNKKEIYKLNTAQIIAVINDNMHISYRAAFIRFLSFLFLFLNDNKVKCNYSVSRIKTGVTINKKKFIKSDIYTPEEYHKLFAYVIDTRYHIKKIINSSNDDKYSYISTWLYVALHLNNLWRRHDIINFPRLQVNSVIDNYNIENLEWFLKNDISDNDSKCIILIAERYNYLFSKTNEYGNFFCSEILEKPLATILVILEYYVLNYLDERSKFKYGAPIMVFSNFKYPGPTEKMLENLFQNFEIKGFSFSSIKMNKTLSTLVYDTAKRTTPSGYNQLLLPKYMRSHLKIDSTIHYVEFSKQELEKASFELFEIGELGYIVDSFFKLVDNNLEQNDKNKYLISIKQNIGDALKIEKISNFINSFRNESMEIFNLIDKSGFEKTIISLNDIYRSASYVRQKDSLCLFSECKLGCNEFNCSKCKYSVPVIFLIYVVATNLTKNINSYFKTNILINKFKLSLNIHKQIKHFIEIINMYGKEYAYSFINIPRDEFIERFNAIQEPSEIVKLLNTGVI